MGGWRRAVQLGSRLVRSSNRSNSCRSLTAVSGEHWSMYIEFLCPAAVRSQSQTRHAGSHGCTRCFTVAANATLHPQTVWLKTLTPTGPGQLHNLRTFADLPAHSELTMPSLSPTMNQVMLCYLCLQTELCNVTHIKQTSQACQLTVVQGH